MDSDSRHLTPSQMGLLHRFRSRGLADLTNLGTPWRIRLVRHLGKTELLQIRRPDVEELVSDSGQAQTETTDLLHRVGRGDVQAMEKCIDSYGPLVWSVVQRRVKARTDAEDLVQEIFIEIWKCADRYRPEVASENGFIAMIARRRSIDWIRKQQRLPIISTLESAPELPAPSAAPGKSLDHEQLWKVLNQLPEETQRLFALHFDKGMTHREISETTGIPLGSIKTRLRRGLIDARKLLKRPASGVNHPTEVLP